MSNTIEDVEHNVDMPVSEQSERTYRSGNERHYWSVNGKPLCNDDMGEVFGILNKMAEKFGIALEERTKSSVEYAGKFGGFMNVRIFFEVDCQRRDPDEVRYECGVESDT